MVRIQFNGGEHFGNGRHIHSSVAAPDEALDSSDLQQQAAWMPRAG